MTHRRTTGLVALLIVTGAWAQPPSHEPPRPQNASTLPAIAAPAAGPSRAGALYRSAFEGYRRFQADEPMRDWREANGAVREAGGHIGILKAAQAGGHADVPPPTTVKKPD